jgi:DNA-binding XRE family transcriptional regulator
VKPVNQTIREARTRLRLRDTDVAACAGLSIHEYCDVESYEDEAFRVVHLGKMRRLCDVLGLDILDLFAIGCASCGKREQVAAGHQGPRDEMIRARRANLGLTQDQLGDLIGFETVAIVDMEKDPDFLETWSVELIVELAGHLELPAQVLLGVICKKCGQ